MRRTDAQQGFSSAAADADVIVVGCGLAGLSAALAAAQRRARVVLFDSSSDLFATNDVTDRLYFNAVDPERQGDLGITDSSTARRWLRAAGAPIPRSSRSSAIKPILHSSGSRASASDSRTRSARFRAASIRELASPPTTGRDVSR